MDSAQKSALIDAINAIPDETVTVQDTNQKWYLFLQSTRFWVMILGALSIYGQQKGVLGEPEMQLFATISGLFVGVRTVDRISEQLSKGA